MQSFSKFGSSTGKRYSSMKAGWRWLKNPLNFFSLLLIAFLAYTVLVPLYQMISYTFQWHAEDMMSSPACRLGEWTLFHWGEALTGDISQALFYTPLLHSLEIGVCASALSFLIGGSLAWLVVKSDMPYKGAVSWMAIIPYILPSWVKASAWLTVFQNKQLVGYPGLFEAIFHVRLPVWFSYGPFPIILTLSSHDFALFYLLLSASLRIIGGDLDEAAEIVGAGRGRILRKITLPLLLPSILSATLLSFAEAVASVGTTAFLGLPVRYYTLATRLYDSMKSQMNSLGYILATVIVLISGLCILGGRHLTGKRRSYTTVTGKGTVTRLVPLGKYGRPVSLLALIYLFCAGLFPMGILTYSSFMSEEGNFSPRNFTLQYWTGTSHILTEGQKLYGVLRDSTTLLATKNSIEIALAAAVISSLLGILCGYIITRKQSGPISQFLEHMTFLPHLIPSLALSTAFLALFSRPFLFFPPLYGTIGILILISVVKKMPLTTRAGIGSMMQISRQLEEAAVVEGISWPKRYFRIVLPLIKSAFLSGFFLAFTSVMKELDLIIILVTPATGTLTSIIFSDTLQGVPQYADALMVIVSCIVIGMYLLAKKISNTGGPQSRRQPEE